MCGSNNENASKTGNRHEEIKKGRMNWDKLYNKHMHEILYHKPPVYRAWSIKAGAAPRGGGGGGVICRSPPALPISKQPGAAPV